MSSLKIGQVAELAGVGVDTVRYYERIGILPAAARRLSGYRMFDTSAVERIKLVKQFQELSLSLDEIQGMMFAVAEDHSTCARESARVEGALRRVEDKIAELTALRKKLRVALERCSAGSCDLVEKIGGASQRRQARKRA